MGRSPADVPEDLPPESPSGNGAPVTPGGGDKAAGALERWNKFFNESHDSIATDMEVYMTSPRDAESAILQKPDVDARSKAAKQLSVGAGPAVAERTGGAGIQR